MAQLAPKSLNLTECDRQELEKLLNRHNTAQQIALRAHIILLADKGNNNRESDVYDGRSCGTTKATGDRLL